MSERILIEGGTRRGRTFAAEGQFRAAIAEGKEVFTQRNGVYFQVTGAPDGPVVYTALTERPEGV